MKGLAQPVIMPVQEFPVSLKQLLDQRGISASELARMMAYKSRNSIFRILDGAGGQSARQAFFDKLMMEDPLGLTDEERAMLTQAMEVSRVGLRTFINSHAMREMLMSAGGCAQHVQVGIDVPDGDVMGFVQRMGEMACGRKVQVIIMGCCHREIFEMLREHVCKGNIVCEVEVKHLIYTGAEEIVHNISAIQPMLYSDQYTAYCVEPGLLSRERERFYRQNSIYIIMTEQSGEAYVLPLVLIDRGIFIPLNRVKITRDDGFKRYFDEDLKKLPLLKAQIPGSGKLESYLKYTDECRKLEGSRAIYTIRQDIPLTCIHPEILLPCVKEEFWQMAGEAQEEIKTAFWKIHLQRHDRLFDRRKVCCMILSQEAMRQFARTGRQSDHFFAIRTYTKAERVQILSQLLDQVKAGGGFRLHFFTEDFEPPIAEIGLYEGVGTLMNKPHTHYDLAGDHAEAIITQEEFCERYREFYVNDLLEEHVIGQEETLQLLNELIAIAENAQ